LNEGLLQVIENDRGGGKEEQKLLETSPKNNTTGAECGESSQELLDHKTLFNPRAGIAAECRKNSSKKGVR